MGHFSGGFGGFSDAGGFHGFGGSGTHTYHFEGGEGDDIFGDIFGNMFGGGKKSSFHQGASGFNGFHRYSGGFGADAASEKGSDAQAEINISFDDAAFGVDRVITLSGTDGSRAESSDPYPGRYRRWTEHPLKRQGKSRYGIR